jgi:hypothetical protein
MRTPLDQQPAESLSIKELISMKKRIALGAFVLAAAIISVPPVAGLRTCGCRRTTFRFCRRVRRRRSSR